MRQSFFDKFKNKFYEKYPFSKYVFLNESTKINHVIVIIEGIKIDCRSRGLLEGKIPIIPRFYINQEIEKLNNYSFKIIKSTRKFLKIENKYGICLIANKGVGKYNIGIKSAINKTEYYKKWLNDKYGNKYDFSLIEYNNSISLVKIKCKTHGVIEILPKNLSRGRLCNLCSEENLSNNPFKHTTWFNRASKSRLFESFKVYIIKCENKNEIFYKIGKTYMPINKRLKSIPYSCEIIKIYEKLELNKENSVIISNLETKLKNKNKIYKYTPLIDFGGNSECYKQLI